MQTPCGTWRLEANTTLDIGDMGIQMKNQNTDEVIFQVNPDGSSFHRGPEVFAGGILVQYPGGMDAISLGPGGTEFSPGGVQISCDLNVQGQLTKAAGSFRIDHPLDPENKYLYHSFVESPDMMNIYNGNVTLDSSGEAEVALTDYFEALNKDFRYQLTPIGGPGPGPYVASEIAENRFRIAGGIAGLKVSWQVTGVRNDVYARENRIQAEVDKRYAAVTRRARCATCARLRTRKRTLPAACPRPAVQAAG